MGAGAGRRPACSGTAERLTLTGRLGEPAPWSGVAAVASTQVNQQRPPGVGEQVPGSTDAARAPDASRRAARPTAPPHPGGPLRTTGLQRSPSARPATCRCRRPSGPAPGASADGLADLTHAPRPPLQGPPAPGGLRPAPGRSARLRPDRAGHPWPLGSRRPPGPPAPPVPGGRPSRARPAGSARTRRSGVPRRHLRLRPLPPRYVPPLQGPPRRHGTAAATDPPAPTVGPQLRPAPPRAGGVAATAPSGDRRGDRRSRRRSVPAASLARSCRRAPVARRVLVPSAATRRSHRSRVLIEWTAVLGGALLVALVVKVFLFQAFVIPSESMVPTLEVGDRVLVNKLSYRLHDVHRGDVVVFERPPAAADARRRLGPDQTGRRPARRHGRGLGRRRVRQRPSLSTSATCPGARSPRTSPGSRSATDEVFVMGDNRQNSRDSRFFGPVPDRPDRRPGLRPGLAARRRCRSCPDRPRASRGSVASGVSRRDGELRPLPADERGRHAVDVVAEHAVETGVEQLVEHPLVLRVPAERVAVEAVEEGGEAAVPVAVVEVDGVDARRCAASPPAARAPRRCA